MPDGERLTNWAGNVAFAATRLHRPRTVEQLQEVIASAARIRAIGTGHSFNELADTAGELVTTADLRLRNRFDTEATVTVAAGARYADVVAALHERGRALPNLASLPHLSVAGAVATATHGSGDRNQCLSASLVAAEMVRADGELVTLRTGDTGFPGAAVALGALGVATRLTLATVPAFELRQRVWLDAPLPSVLEHFAEIMASGYSVSLFRHPHRREVIDQIWVLSPADDEAPDGAAWGARPAAEPVHPIAGQDARATTPQLGERRSWFEVLPHFRVEFTPSSGDEQQSEYLIAREHGPAALAAVHRLDLTDALQVMEVRTIAADDLWLSPAHGRDSVAFHFTWHNRDAAVRRGCAAVEAALAEFGPRPHWGKVFGLDPAVLRARYPRLPDFRRLAAEHDPERKFGNRFLERFIY